jgi:hypothetical protein
VKPPSPGAPANSLTGRTGRHTAHGHGGGARAIRAAARSERHRHGHRHTHTVARAPHTRAPPPRPLAAHGDVRGTPLPAQAARTQAGDAGAPPPPPAAAHCPPPRSRPANARRPTSTHRPLGPRSIRPTVPRRWPPWPRARSPWPWATCVARGSEGLAQEVHACEFSVS